MYVGSRNILPTNLPTYLPISCNDVQLRLETKLLKILTNMGIWECKAPRPGRDVMDEKLCCIQHEHGVAVNVVVKLYRQGN